MRRDRFLFHLFFACFFCSHISAQTYYGFGGTVKDNKDTTTFKINVSNLTKSTLDSSYGLESVWIYLNHARDKDIKMYLRSPDGTMILLTSDNGELGKDYVNTIFNGSDTNKCIIFGTPPYSGTFAPEEMLGNVNNNELGNGVWKLLILDNDSTGNFSGNLTAWGLKFSNKPAQPINFRSSKLPIFMINTNGQEINDTVTADLGVIYHGQGNENYLSDPFNHFNSKISIKLHGSSTFGFPKHSYGIETRDASGINNFDFPLLNLPTEHDWVLRAMYDERSLGLNALAHTTYQQMGDYAGKVRYCEVFINGKYEGIYLLVEKIKRDKNRVNISKLTPTDTSGVDLTGGYIVKIDHLHYREDSAGWKSSIPPDVNPIGQYIYFQPDYPKPGVIKPAQLNYIKTYMDSFETVLRSPAFNDPVNGYRKYIDVHSFIDYFLLTEYSMNGDGYRISTYMYKDKITKGGKLVIGPPWDYNGSWGLSWHYYNWVFDFGLSVPNDRQQPPFWWKRLLEDSTFANEVQCRWDELRGGTLNETTIFKTLDSLNDVVRPYELRNFTRYPYEGSFDKDIAIFKKSISIRLGWLDVNMPGICALTGIKKQKQVDGIHLFPNPFDKEITLNFETLENVQLELYNETGQIVLSEKHAGVNKIRLQLSEKDLPAGIYLLNVRTSTNLSSFRLIKQN